MQYILLNVGTATRKAFKDGISDSQLKRYKTTKLALHIDANGAITFLHRNRPVDFTDSYIFTRLRATDQHFCGILYEYFAHNNIPANDEIKLSYPNSAEKTSQMLLLAMAGIKVPETFIFREESYEANRSYIESRITFPAVFKVDGSLGRNVHVAENMGALEELIMKKEPSVLAMVQPFLKNEYDTRTLVAYDQVLGSMKRTRRNGYLNNVELGALIETHELSEAERELAIHATRACKMDFAGVDIIPSESGPVVLEVNESPRIHGFESVYDFKVFTKVAELIKEKYGK